jgi:hypothetical protein
VDVSSLVVANAQASKLVDPRTCPFHDSSPPSQPTSVAGTTLGEARHDMPRSYAAPDRGRVVAAVPEHAVRPLPGSPAFAMQRGNRIHQRQGFLRVVPIRTGQTHCERHTARVADQMPLAPALGAIRGIRPGLVPAVDRTDGTTVHDCPRPINLVGAREPFQQRKMNQIPYARQLPIPQAPPARHPRSAPEFLREHVPGNAAAKDKDDARQARAIRHARAATLWPSWKNRQEGFDKIPQRIWKQRRGHTPFTLLRRRGSGFGGFVTCSKEMAHSGTL